MSKIYTIIPVYDEALRLDIEAFLSHLRDNPNQQIIFVNDGSSDNTIEIIEDMRQKAKGQIHTLSLSSNLGKAEAIRRGVLKVFEKKKDAVFFGYIDADLATPLDQIQYLVDGLIADSEKQIVLGSRVQLIGYDIKRSISRHYVGRIFATYVSLLFGFKIYDTQCGAKYFRATLDNFALFGEQFNSRWFIDIEILLRFLLAKDKTYFEKEIIERPLKKWHEKGDSKLKWKDFVLTPFVLFKIKQKYL